MRAFHGTSVENVASIREHGLLRRFEGVYLTDSVESAARWKALVGMTVIAVIEVEVKPEKLIEGTDHSPVMQIVFGCGKSWLSQDSIPKSRIKRVHYLKVQTNETTID